MSLFIDVHALHTLPPSNVNRDDTGAPKSATFGGVIRQRVSSQSWKRAIRDDFKNHLDISQLGYRTKRVVAKIAEEIREIAPTWDEESSLSAAAEALEVGGIKVNEPKIKKNDEADVVREPEVGYLLFLSTQQIRSIAKMIVDAGEQKLNKKQIAEALDTNHSIDIAAFGRMVADAPAFNVDAAVQVAHAIGVHESEPEFDYFTAVDDAVVAAEETGAGMIGTVQMMSSTLYRYATVNVSGLVKNLGNQEAAVEATSAFVRSFILSMPTGKQNAYANRTLPEVVYISVREDRPISLVNAFEEPVEASDSAGRRREAATRLAEEAKAIGDAYGVSPVAEYVLAIGDLGDAFKDLATPLPLPELLENLRETVAGKIA